MVVNTTGATTTYFGTTNSQWDVYDVANLIYRSKRSEEMPSVARASSLLPGMQFGCDPELFVVDDGGRFRCADGLLPGTKAEPYKVDGGAIQVDGFAAEVNTDPATSYKEFNSNLDKVLGQVQKMLPKGWALKASPVATFDEDEWDRAPDRAKELGCSPDFNAWTGSVNAPPDGDLIPRFRTAAGHIHLGWTEGAANDDAQHLMNCRDLVKQLDMFLGAWSVTQESADGLTRRALYGKAGACRIKPYGVEYRVLGNFWVLDKDRRMAVWNRTCKAIEFMKSAFIPDSLAKYSFEEPIKQYISTGNLDSIVEEIFVFPLQTLDPRRKQY